MTLNRFSCQSVQHRENVKMCVNLKSLLRPAALHILIEYIPLSPSNFHFQLQFYVSEFLFNNNAQPEEIPISFLYQLNMATISQ
jgi:hypothetical protein